MAKMAEGLGKIVPITPKGYEMLVNSLNSEKFSKKLSLRVERMSLASARELFEIYLQLVPHKEASIHVKQVFSREIENTVQGYVYVLGQAAKPAAGEFANCHYVVIKSEKGRVLVDFYINLQDTKNIAAIGRIISILQKVLRQRNFEQIT